MLFGGSPAHADVAGAFKAAWKCAKEVGASAASLGKDLVNKAEAVANMSAAAATCTATAGGQAQVLAFVTTTLGTIKASDASLLPTGKCKERIHAQLAKPFALGIAALLPDGSAKKSLLSLTTSDQGASWIWSTLSSAPPPFGTIPSQLDCGCEMIDGALTLTDMSTVANAIKNTSKACAGVLDEVGLGFLNDWGSAVFGFFGGTYKAIAGKWEQWQGKKEPAPDEIAYQGLYGVYVPNIATRLALLAKGTKASTQKFEAASGGWSNYTNYQQPLQTWGDLLRLCKDYYKARRGDQSGKCAGFETRAQSQAETEGDKLRTQATSMTVFRMKLYGWLDKEWLWRQPPCQIYGNPTYQTTAKGDENKCTIEPFMANDRWKLGTYKDNKVEPWNYTATGLYDRARKALVEANYDMDVAHQAVLAGAYVQLQKATLDQWNHPGAVANVRARWLPQWMPTAPMGGAYGCAAGPIGKECEKILPTTFDKVCHPLMRDAWVLGPGVFDVAMRFGAAKTNCTKLLTSITNNSTALVDAGGKDVPAKAQTYCPPPDKDRQKAATCVQKLSTYWDECAVKQVGAFGGALDPTRKCFENKVKLLTPYTAPATKTPTNPNFKPTTKIN